MTAARCVFSTERAARCPVCDRPTADCACRRATPRAAGDGVVRVGRETKGRKGGGVTVVAGLPLEEARLRELARELKRRCGAGGTVKDGVIEIQGEHRERLLGELQRLGYRVKKSGG